MYTSYIGKKFLHAWNAREGKNLTARQFFDEVMFPVFFDDEKHLLHVSNSPFFQKLSSNDLKLGKSEPEIRKGNLHSSILNKPPNGSFFVGYGAEKLESGTSGQLTNMPRRITYDEIYESWIGVSLALSVSKYESVLIDDQEINWIIYSGWEKYRQFLNDSPIQGRKLAIWNSQWLIHQLTDPEPKFLPQYQTNRTIGSAQIVEINWISLVLALCKIRPKARLTLYAFNLDKANTTIGFVNLILYQINELYEAWDHYLIERNNSILTYLQIEKLEPGFTFKEVCKNGAIGLRSLMPAQLNDHIYKKKPLKVSDLIEANDAKIIKIHLYKLWIHAMLNRKELIQLAKKIAAILQETEWKSPGGKATNVNLSTDIRNSTNIRDFGEKIKDFMEKNPEIASDEFHEQMDVFFTISNDQFPLFITLVRFEYAFIQAQNQIKFSN